MRPPAFTEKTFALLGAISLTPTAGFYRDHREEFRLHVEQPLQSVMKAAASRLPAMMLDRLETRRNVFSRFLKNDFGRGGAWANYWGAFYPKGSRRLADMQLAVWMNRERLHISFYIGEYGPVPRERFSRNCKRYRHELAVPLAPLIGNHRIRLAWEGRTVLDEGGNLVPERPMTWDEWLEDPRQGDFWAFLPLAPGEAIAMGQPALADLTARTFADLFPLALLAMEEEPLPVIHAFGS